MIKKIWGITLLAISIVCNACAQEHQQQQAWLDKAEAAKSELVVLNNNKEIIPVKELKDQKFASINLGFSYFPAFDSLLNKYTYTESFNVDDYTGQNRFNILYDDLKWHSSVVLALTDSTAAKPETIQFIQELKKTKSVITVLFGEGTALKYFDTYEAPLIWCHEQSDISAALAAQVIFGGEPSNARLPQSFSAKYLMGLGPETKANRLGYSVPEAVGINSNRLMAIDDIAEEAIKAAAAPGCAVLVAKNGKVIFNKAYGYHTYQKDQPNRVNDIYDLASVTKIAATTLEVMKLYEDEKIDLEAPISNYLYRTRNTDKANIKVKNVLLHQAGFIPYIPFHSAIKPADHSSDSSAAFSVKVADGYYLRNNYYHDVMWPQMLKVPLRSPGKYVYSDLSMYYMKEIVESITETPLPELVEDNFYSELGLHTTTFLPRNKFSKYDIVPTEVDSYFRDTLIWGYVHDQGAALAGGVSGHAGLFSNITDLATLFQMLLNKGSYGGKTYFKPTTVELFTSKQSATSRRGLGFDRWDPVESKEYPSKYASSQTFGHTGYTGTCVWVDPSRQLVYIFLSNRVYPKVTNKLSQMDIRSRIQDVINKAVDESL